VEGNRKAGQNPTMVVAPIEVEELQLSRVFRLSLLSLGYYENITLL
jgi:hypothetical protein